jgi:hypothetical protein
VVLVDTQWWVCSLESCLFPVSTVLIPYFFRIARQALCAQTTWALATRHQRCHRLKGDHRSGFGRPPPRLPLPPLEFCARRCLLSACGTPLEGLQKVPDRRLDSHRPQCMWGGLQPLSCSGTLETKTYWSSKSGEPHVILNAFAVIIYISRGSMMHNRDPHFNSQLLV